jgi:hypothetical protein
MKARAVSIMVVVLALALVDPRLVLAASDPSIPGQRPLIVIGEAFRFVHGAWACYSVRDKAANQDYRLCLAVLEGENRKKRKKDKARTPCCWMEVEVGSPDHPRVVTRFLAEQTSNGPGELLEAVVQVEGYSPFRVPKKYLKPDDPKVGETQVAHVVRRLEQKAIRHAGKDLWAWELEARDADGKEIRAVVNEELPPIGVYSAETDQIRMEIVDWGMDARSKITGTPTNFYVWILEQIAKEMSEPHKK